MIPFSNHLRDKLPNLDQTVKVGFWGNLTICQDDICSCNISPGGICPNQQYLAQFQPKLLNPIFPIFFGPPTILLDANFLDQKSFGPKIILDLKFLDPIFLDQNCFGSKLFLTKKISDPNVFEHTMFWTQNFFAHNFFLTYQADFS